jgi:hypothetical protein
VALINIIYGEARENLRALLGGFGLIIYGGARENLWALLGGVGLIIYVGESDRERGNVTVGDATVE